MPDVGQLNRMWMADAIGLTAARGRGPEHEDYIPGPEKPFTESKGEIIGHVVYDAENDGIKNVPFRDLKDSSTPGFNSF